MVLNNNKKLFVVLGMHRSGTSAIARALKVFDIQLGDNFIPPVENINPKGFWEDMDINALNIEMMKAINLDWHYLAPIQPSDTDALREKGYFARAEALISTKLANSTSFGIKDPRIAKLLPFWKEVFDHCQFEQYYILALRSPLSVAESLAKRDGFPHRKSYFLWLDHVINSLRYTQREKRIVLDYDRLLQHPKKELSRVSKCFGLHINAVELKEYATNFLDNEFCHTKFSKEKVLINDKIPPLIGEIYSLMLDGASDKFDISSMDFESKLKSWSDEFERIKPALILADELCSIQAEQNALDIRKQVTKFGELLRAVAMPDSKIFKEALNSPWYLEHNPDLVAARIDPYEHWIMHGMFEGRLPAASLVVLAEKLVAEQRQWLEIRIDKEERELRQIQHESLDRQRVLEAEIVQTKLKARDEVEAQLRTLAERERAFAEQYAQQEQTLRVAIEDKERESLERLRVLEEAQLRTLAERERAFAEQHSQLQLEMGTIKSSLTWRLTAPLRKLGQRCLPSKPDKAASEQPHQTFDAANKNSVGTKAAINYYQRKDRNLEEISMANNSMTPANCPYVSITSLDEMLAYHDEAFVCVTYRTLLLRDPDSDGLSYYLEQLRRGVDKLDVLNQICRSKEAQHHAVKIPGLQDALRHYRWLKLPIIGAMLRRQGTTPNRLNLLENQLALLREVNRERFGQIEKEVASLSQLIAHQLQEAAIERFGYTSSDSWKAVEMAFSLDGRRFLEYLFNLAMGRPPLMHEIDHYLAMLDKGDSKLHIIESIFSCAECKKWHTQDRIAKVQNEVKVFPKDITNVIQRLGYTSIANWQAVEKLFSLDNRSFMESLFKLALGQYPLTHEIDSYLFMLDKGDSKLHIIESLFSSAESQKWLKQERNAGMTGVAYDFPRDITKQRILVIDQCTPTPDKDAGSVTAWFFLKALVDLNYDVTFIPDNLQSLGRYTDNLRALGVRCLTSNEIKSVEKFLAKSGDQIDFVLLYRVYTARLNLPLVKKYAPQAKIVFDTVDLHYLREERQADLSKDEAQIKAAQYTKQAEYEMMRAADATIVLSRAEQQIIKKEDTSINVFNIPLLLDIPGCKTPFAKRCDIVFIGGFLHQPNIDAIKYFVNEIWPMVSPKLAGANLLVIGSNIPSDIRALGEIDNRIKIIGYVENLDSYFNQCRLSIAPLRYGSGIKGKIGTSASYGVPCVATTLAAEGMGLVDGVEILVADGAKQFAEKLVHLYNNEKLWNQISKGSLDFVQRNYSYETGKAHLQQLFNSLTVDSVRETPGYAGGHAKVRPIQRAG